MGKTAVYSGDAKNYGREYRGDVPGVNHTGSFRLFRGVGRLLGRRMCWEQHDVRKAEYCRRYIYAGSEAVVLQ